MTGFRHSEGSDCFECRDCGRAIDLEQYRRKVPRCDDCEAEVGIQELRRDFESRERAA